MLLCKNINMHFDEKNMKGYIFVSGVQFEQTAKNSLRSSASKRRVESLCVFSEQGMNKHRGWINTEDEDIIKNRGTNQTKTERAETKKKKKTKENEET
jgi:hypothetical protein